MIRWILGAGVAALLAPVGSARAQYHQSGIQVLGIPLLGVYKAPAGAAGYGYSPGYSPSYAPAYSAPMMAPTGCNGYSAGYGFASPGFASPAYSYSAPMMAPGGCTGYSAYSPGYSAPAYGYGYGAPQAGIFPAVGAAGGILEALRLFKEIRDAVDQLRG